MVSVEDFLKMEEQGPAERSKYDWSKLNELINGSKPFTVADCEKLMPEVPYRNQIRNYLERLVRQGKLKRTPKGHPRTYYLNIEVYRKYLASKQKAK